MFGGPFCIALNKEARADDLFDNIDVCNPVASFLWNFNNEKNLCVQLYIVGQDCIYLERRTLSLGKLRCF